MIGPRTLCNILVLCCVILVSGFLLVHSMDPVLAKAYGRESFLFINYLVNVIMVKAQPSPSFEGFAFVAKRLFFGLVTLLVCVGCFFLFFRYKEDDTSSGAYRITALSLIIVTGTMVRLMLAYLFFGNYDMESWLLDANIAVAGKNVYAETFRYNYSPLWFWILGALKHLQLALHITDFHFVVKSFLTFVDLLSLFVLLSLARKRSLNLIRTALLFYLNPVSFLLTGFHGQTENLATLMVLFGIFCFYELAHRPLWSRACLWFFATVGFVIKHSFFIELFTCINAAFKEVRLKFLLAGVSCVLFALSFAPYWADGSEGIIKNVFMYAPYSGLYGLTSLWNVWLLQYVFAIGWFVFPCMLKTDDVVAQCLLAALFFLTFTTGRGVQYFVMPIAFLALRPSAAGLIYTVATSLFLLGSEYNLELPILSALRWNVVWFAAVYWFVTEMYEVRVTLKEKFTDRGKVFNLRT